MKTKAIVATLLIAEAASADARFAWPYPRKAVSPDESGHWIVITSNSWPYRAESEPDAQKSSPAKKEKTQRKTGMFHSGLRQEPAWASRSDSELQTVPRRQANERHS